MNFLAYYHKDRDHILIAARLVDQEYMVIFDDTPCMRVETLRKKDLVRRPDVVIGLDEIRHQCETMTRRANAGV